MNIFRIRVGSGPQPALSIYDNGGIDLNNENPERTTVLSNYTYFNDDTPDVGEEISLGVDVLNPLNVNPFP